MGCPSAKPERCFEIYDFEVMLCVAELGSFRKASLRLDIGQYAVSRRIQKIEDVIGVSLFERYAGGARLTAAGACFAKRARAVISNFEEAVSVARAAATGEQGNLRIGLIASLSRGVIRNTTLEFFSRHPNVEVQVAGDHQADWETGSDGQGRRHGELTADDLVAGASDCVLSAVSNGCCNLVVFIPAELQSASSLIETPALMRRTFAWLCNSLLKGMSCEALRVIFCDLDIGQSPLRAAGNLPRPPNPSRKPRPTSHSGGAVSRDFSAAARNLGHCNQAGRSRQSRRPKECRLLRKPKLFRSGVRKMTKANCQPVPRVHLCDDKR